MRRYNIGYSNTGITPELSDDGAWVRIGDAKRAIAAERERCAKVCENMPRGVGDEGGRVDASPWQCATAIRKGETP